MNQRSFAGAVFASIFLIRSFDVTTIKMMSNTATTNITIVDKCFLSMDSLKISMK